ncbi:MAG TPA: transcription termination/antitermination protein NusA [Chloroflexi bacterium]|nr:transcription termination/antitermination protein NusA [Chloroflexota bacterium]
MKSDFLLAFNQICSDRGLSREVVLDALKMALVSAYQRNLEADTEQNVTAEIDMDSGKARVYIEKQVVEEVSTPELEIDLQAARVIDPDVEIGGSVMIENTPKDFGRIAAQSAKQIILQRIREAERDARYDQYVEQEGEIVHGTVQNIKPQVVTLSLDGTEAILPRSQQVPGERYTLHQRLRAYVLEVRKTGRGPRIIVSRSHQNMLRRLLELEVPEIFNGSVEIQAIAREASSRSKVAVIAKQAGVDPVGACVGMRGVRIQSIVNELGGEKIDVIEWSPDASVFISKALSPARVLSVQLDHDPVEGKTANVVVPDDQLSLAIGRSGQNARLAAKLTGWRIDIQGVTEAARWALQQVNEDDNVLPNLGLAAEQLPRVAKILRRHEEESMPYNNEELLAMRQVIEGVKHYYASQRDTERAHFMAEEKARLAAIEEAKAERRTAIESARAKIAERAYEIPLADMALSTRVLGHLERSELETAGDLLEHLAEGDEGLLKLDGIGPKSLAEIKASLDKLDLSKAEEIAETEALVEIEEPGAVVEDAIEAVAEDVAEDAADEVADEVAIAVEDEAEIEAEAIVEEIDVTEAAPETEAADVPVEEEPVALETTTEETVKAEDPLEAETEEKEKEKEKKGKRVKFVEDEQLEALEGEYEDDRDRERRLRRKLIRDEETGMLIPERRRKGSRQVEEWEKYLD